MMFSLCIPTMDRYDKFISVYLPKYLENSYIDEIIITDENGNDVEKIQRDFQNNNKLVLVKNEKRLGTLCNKLKACSFAKNEWIALIDSDNFADNDYFETACDYISKNIPKDQHNVILSPCFAEPSFNYSYLAGLIYKKGTFKSNLEFEYYSPHRRHDNISEIMMNTGNYVINKYLIDNVDLTNEIHKEMIHAPKEVLFLNILLFEQLDLEFHVVPNMKYLHVVHDGSYTMIETPNYNHCVGEIWDRYEKIKLQ